MQDVSGEFACRVVAQLRVGADGVRDELETNLVGSAKRCERSHRISFVVEHVRSQPSCSILLTLRRFAGRDSHVLTRQRCRQTVITTVYAGRSAAGMNCQTVLGSPNHLEAMRLGGASGAAVAERAAGKVASQALS